MAAVIKIKFDEKTKRFPYPKKTISEFLDDLRKEFAINEKAILSLYEDDEELSTSFTLDALGIAAGSTLILKASIQGNGYTIKVQQISGKLSEFQLENQSTLKDLYDTIHKNIQFTTTFPLLFNHRMHIFLCPKSLTEPISNFLPLTDIKNDGVPHFYFFECELQFKTRQYAYSKNLKDIFLQSDLWQPMSAKQTDLALSIYLNTMCALVRVFLTKKEVDFDSIHNVYMPQFLIVLRRYLFPPACLSFKHALEGALFNFEKPLLSEAFFQFFRTLLPENIPDTDLFLYTPYVFCWIFCNGDHTSMENACYESCDLIRSSAATPGNAVGLVSDEYYVEPVRLLNNKIVSGASDRFVLMEYNQVKNEHNLTENDYQRQTDLVGLLMVMSHKKSSSENDDSSQEGGVFEQYSSHYTLWIPDPKISLLSIANVTEQKGKINRLSEEALAEIKSQLSTNDLYSIFTFAEPTALSKHNHAQLVLLKSGKVVYLNNVAKSDKNTFMCFDPLGLKQSFSKSEVASSEIFTQHPYLVVRENAADIRKIEQITFILFDISGSMHVMVGSENDKRTLLELSTLAFGAWRDRLVSYKLPHALGLIYFGADDEPPGDLQNPSVFLYRLRRFRAQIDDRIVVQCDITRDFIQFDHALENRPNCGFDTPLYDAIDIAIEKIRLFRQNSQSRLSPTHKALIVCLTDGTDTCSKASQSNVLEKLLADNIIFDAISFDSKPNNVLIEFSEKTKGYYYEEIPHDKESMLNLFELEASISVQDRDDNVYGKVKQSQRRKPKLLDKPAVASRQARIGDGRSSSIALKRIILEIKNLNKSNLNTFDLFISNEDIFFWKVIMHGETGTPYANGRWLLFIEFPPNYPQQPPEIRFVTKIYHCNINDDGKICHDILSTAWSQKTSMHSIFMEILRLLKEPNSDDALSSVKGAQYKDSKENYENTILEWKAKYASASVDELKKQYSLE